MSLKQLCGTPIPDRDPIAGKEGRLTPAWHDYLGRLPLTLDSTPVRVGFASLTAQAASIGATNMAPAGLPAGLYRASYYTRITQAATTSSTLTVTLGWTDGGVALTFSGAAVVGNTTADYQTDSLMFRLDAGGTVNYSTTYGSVGGTVMQHSLYWVLELVKAL